MPHDGAALPCLALSCCCSSMPIARSASHVSADALQASVAQRNVLTLTQFSVGSPNFARGGWSPILRASCDFMRRHDLREGCCICRDTADVRSACRRPGAAVRASAEACKSWHGVLCHNLQQQLCEVGECHALHIGQALATSSCVLMRQSSCAFARRACRRMLQLEA